MHEQSPQLVIIFAFIHLNSLRNGRRTFLCEDWEVVVIQQFIHSLPIFNGVTSICFQRSNSLPCAKHLKESLAVT